MKLTTLSLRARSVFITFFALLLITPTAMFALDKAYSASLTQATHQQLKLSALMLISEFEFMEDAPTMPIQVYDEQLNLPDSGVYGYIKWQQALVWQSASSVAMQIPSLPPPPTTGEETFFEINDNFVYIYTAEFETSDGFSPVNFYVFYDQDVFNQERASFLKTLWQWLLIVDALLLLCFVVGIMFLLKPLSRLRLEVSNTSSGKQTLINSDYPKEVTPLASSINQLIVNEQQQRERYKNSLSDLAHSLKTPLTVALGEIKNQPNLQQPLKEIEAIIHRQLKRAAAHGPGYYSPISVKPLVKKLIAAMQKVHVERELEIASNITEDVSINVESTDLMECLGNVLDNACKAARKHLVVELDISDSFIDIIVDDDGPGIQEKDRQRLLTRGQRLDTYHEGQGIGMALVSDIMESYGGKLSVEKSPMNGARIRLCFKRG